MKKTLKIVKGDLRTFETIENGQKIQTSLSTSLRMFNKKGRMTFRSLIRPDQTMYEQKIFYVGPFVITFERDFAIDKWYHFAGIAYVNNNRIIFSFNRIETRNVFAISWYKGLHEIKRITKAGKLIEVIENKLTDFNGILYQTSTHTYTNEDHVSFIKSTYNFGNNNRCFIEIRDAIVDKLINKMEIDFQRDIVLWEEDLDTKVVVKYQYDECDNITSIEETYENGNYSRSVYENIYWEDKENDN